MVRSCQVEVARQRLIQQTVPFGFANLLKLLHSTGALPRDPVFEFSRASVLAPTSDNRAWTERYVSQSRTLFRRGSRDRLAPSPVRWAVWLLYVRALLSLASVLEVVIEGRPN